MSYTVTPPKNKSCLISIITQKHMLYLLLNMSDSLYPQFSHQLASAVLPLAAAECHINFVQHWHTKANLLLPMLRKICMAKLLSKKMAQPLGLKPFLSHAMV